MIFELIFNNPTLVTLSFVTFFLFLFYAFGAVLQKYFSFKKSNKYLSLPIGIFAYLFVTMIVYSPLVLFRLDRIWFSVVELFKDISILFIVILYYRSWTPDYKSYSHKTLLTLPLSLLSIAFGLIIFFVLNELVTISHSSTAAFNEAMNNLIKEDIGSGEFVFNTLGSDNSLSVLERYESLYYWMAIKEISLNTVDPNIFMEYLMPFIIITALSCAVLGTVVDSEKSIVSFLIAIIIIGLSSALEWYVGANSERFYILSVIIFAVLLLSNYSYQRKPHDSTLFVSMFLLLTLQCMTYWAIPILMIFGTAGIALCIEKRGQIGRAMLIFASLIAVSVIVFSILMLPKQFSVAEGNFFLSFTLVLIFFALIITPLYSLSNASGRRNELVSFEYKAYKRRNINLITISLIVSVLSLGLLYLLANLPLGQMFNEYFTSIFADSAWIGFAIYAFGLFVPSVLIFIMIWKYNYSSLLSAIPYLTFLFNPITTELICQTSGWQVGWELIFIPQFSIFIFWGLTELLKLIPEKLRL